ncbi:MATE family efflux transporter [Gordonibacter sp.]|uniref:MATE family efflux transporter n=1 Tax=Gordonibacter sp. TaxID=1968902 RepID=UPI002FCB2ACD
MSSFNLSFTEGSQFRRLLAFALPLMAVNLLQYVYQTVDMVVVGQVVGNVGLVSISNASNAAYLVNAFIIGLTMGGGVMVARAVGASDVAGQRRAYAATLVVALVTSILVAVAGVLWTRPAFVANGVPEASLEGACAYTLVICCGCWGPFLLNVAAAFLKAQGDARTPLALVGVSALVNVVLDVVLVGPAGFGVVGAAYATVVAQGFAGIAAFVVTWRRYPGGRLWGAGASVPGSRFVAADSSDGVDGAGAADVGRRMREGHAGSSCGAFCAWLAADIAAVLRVGVPSAVQMAVVNLSYALVTGLLNRYGTDVAAAAGVALQISTLAGLPCWAIGQAITTAAAQNRGAGKLARAYEAVRLGAALNVGVTMGTQIAVQLLAPAIVGLYGLSTPESLDIAVLYLRITCSVNGLFYAAMFSFDSFALGAGSPKLVLVNSLIDAFAIRLGLAVLLSGVLGLGYVGVFVAQAASPVIPAVIGGLYVHFWARCQGVGKRRPASEQRV